MTNDEARMTKEALSPNVEPLLLHFVIRDSSLVIP
jgi:hypothetical protein